MSEEQLNELRRNDRERKARQRAAASDAIVVTSTSVASRTTAPRDSSSAATSTSVASSTVPRSVSIKPGGDHVTDDLTLMSGMDEYNDEYNALEDANIARSRARINADKDRLAVEDDSDWDKLDKLSKEEQQATGKLIQANLQAANEAAIKAGQARMQPFHDLVARRCSNRAMVAAGPINVEAANISAAEQRKRENGAKKAAAMACRRPLFEFGEDNSNIEEESFDDFSYDPTIRNSVTGSIYFKSHEHPISIDKAPDDVSEAKTSPKTPPSDKKRAGTTAPKSPASHTVESTEDAKMGSTSSRSRSVEYPKTPVTDRRLRPRTRSVEYTTGVGRPVRSCRKKR